MSAIAPSIFVAIDFETANSHRDSAIAVALVRVEAGKVVRSEARLIRPPGWPKCAWEWQHVHNLKVDDLAGAEPFFKVWPDLAPMLEGASHLVAHNASFDRAVLRACCNLDRVRFPALPWVCTVQMAKDAWGHASNKLNLVCGRLGIALNHHEAESDATACAQVYLQALAAGATAVPLASRDEPAAGRTPSRPAAPGGAAQRATVEVSDSLKTQQQGAAQTPPAAPAVGQLTLDGGVEPPPPSPKAKPAAAKPVPAPAPAPSVPPPASERRVVPSGKAFSPSEAPRPVPDELDARGAWDLGREVAMGQAVRPEGCDAWLEAAMFGGYCAVRHEQEMARVAVLLELTLAEVRALLAVVPAATTNDETVAEAPAVCGVCKIGALVDGRMCLRCGAHRQEAAA